MTGRIMFLGLLAAWGPAVAPAADHRVASAADVARVAAAARPGDVLVMADGPWVDQAVVFRAAGTPDQPITLRAETPGKVVLSGASSLVIDGDQLVVTGLWLKDAKAPGDGIKIAGRDCRLTDTAVVGCEFKFYVHLSGTGHRVDHCYLAGKTTEAPTLQVEVGVKPNRHRIDANHFGPRPPLGRNGGETIRVGYSHQATRDSGTTVERNLFDRCDGEIEIVSSKSCGNSYRFNTFLDCAGVLTLRHGDRCVVEGNFFLGHHKRGSGGVRVIGRDHAVVNNYVEGVVQGAVWLTAGDPAAPPTGYVAADNAVIAFNTVVDSRGPPLQLDAGFGSSGRTVRPRNVTVVNNLFALPAAGPLLMGTEGEKFRWFGNIASPGATPDHVGVRLIDPRLARAADGLWRPAADGPVRGAAEGEFPAVTTDIDAQPRGRRIDVGCDQSSDATVTNRPLTPADTGPAWMDRAARAWGRPES